MRLREELPYQHTDYLLRKRLSVLQTEAQALQAQLDTLHSVSSTGNTSIT